MPVETFGYLDSLEPTNPVTNEGIANGDDHIRGIKSTLKATFPGLTGAVSRLIGSSWGFLAGPGTSEAPAYSFASEPSMGFWRSGTGLLNFVGRLVGNGAVPVGSLHQFLVPPEGLRTDGGAGAQYLELNGVTYNTSDYPRLAQHLGASGSTFTLTNVVDTGRFLRSRTGSVPAGTRQSNAFKTHTVASTGSTDAQGNHAHLVTGSTGFMDRAAVHGHSYRRPGYSNSMQGGGGSGSTNDYDSGTEGADTNHTHAVAGSTSEAGLHGHNVSVVGTASGDTETRPEALAVIICIKT